MQIKTTVIIFCLNFPNEELFTVAPLSANTRKSFFCFSTGSSTLKKTSWLLATRKGKPIYIFSLPLPDSFSPPSNSCQKSSTSKGKQPLIKLYCNSDIYIIYIQTNVLIFFCHCHILAVVASGLHLQFKIILMVTQIDNYLREDRELNSKTIVIIIKNMMTLYEHMAEWFELLLANTGKIHIRFCVEDDLDVINPER